MERFAVMVDAGYFLKQLIESIKTDDSQTRKDLKILNPEKLIEIVVKKTREVLNIENRELLRVYWYDGVGSKGVTLEQSNISKIQDVTFRSGTINGSGQQKGVDSLIVTDLLELASNHAILDASVITGDGDIVIGVQLAQRKGVRIAVIGVEDQEKKVHHRQSPELICAADRFIQIQGKEFSEFITMQQVTQNDPVKNNPEASSLIREDNLKKVVKTFLNENPELIKTVLLKNQPIDRDTDRKLLLSGKEDLGRALTDDEKIFLRKTFKECLLEQQLKN